MPRRPRPDVGDAELSDLLARLEDRGPSGPSVLEQYRLVSGARKGSAETSASLDRWLLWELNELRTGLAEAEASQAELRRVHERLTSPPWYPAVYLRAVEHVADKAIVAYQGTPRVVTLAAGVARDTLSTGEDVLLTHDLNVILQPLTPSVSRACDVAEFQHTLADGRLLLKSREAEVIACAAGVLEPASLRSGDRVRWDPALAMAFERLPRSTASSVLVGETPAESFAEIGGLDSQIERLQQSIRLHMRHPDLVERYRLRRATSVLLVGPPGVGKTLMARALARWLGEEAPGRRARFHHVKPGALHSIWYSQSEANYREVFREAREAAATDPGVPVVLFFDEVDAIGLTRSEGPARVDDRVLTSFMAELDGMEPRGNVLVVAATNRRDALDPALLRPGRLGDLVLEIPRPSMAAARSILERHLKADMPYAGADQSIDPRRDAIDAAVSRLYAPNGEGQVASIRFRDGTRRPVMAREIANGAMLANIARIAVERACLRELETGDAGIRREDVVEAVAEEVASGIAALTPANAHAHLTGLPQDLTVVGVDPTLGRPRQPHRFVAAA